MQKKVIGLDIGGSKITGIVFSGGKILKELTIITPKNLKDFKYSLAHLLKFLSVEEKISQIGIGAPGRISPQEGKVERSPNLRYLDAFNFKSYFRSLGIKKVEVDNDANCFVRAEWLLGQGKKFNHLIGIILGTGFGGGMVLGGQIYRGSHHWGGEFGKFIIGNSFAEAEFKKARNSKDLKKLAKITSLVCVNIIKTLDPEAIIFGGKVSLSLGAKFLPLAQKEIRPHLHSPKQMPKILVSKLKHSGAIGAALLLI